MRFSWARSGRSRRLLPSRRSNGHDFVLGVRAHTGEVLSVYLKDLDIEKLVQFLSRKDD